MLCAGLASGIPERPPFDIASLCFAGWKRATGEGVLAIVFAGLRGPFCRTEAHQET